MPPKGKPPTKGARQIVEENASTIKFYQTMALAAFLIYSSVTCIFFYDELTLFYISLNVFILIIYVSCIQSMVRMSRPKYTESKQIIDSGLDLNMEGALGEHIKDIIILTSITQVTALLSTYFWLLLLLVPIRAFWLAWINVLGPWFFQEAPEATEKDDKKKKKVERRMRRMQ